MEGLASRIGTGGLLITVTDHPVIKPDKVLHTIPTPFLKNGFLWGDSFRGIIFKLVSQPDRFWRGF